MKWYEIWISSEKTIRLKAKNKSEAKKKAKAKFLKKPGRLIIEDMEEYDY